MNTLLSVDHISKQYPNFKLDDISFNLERGYIMGLVGPNGAGKTTTLKAILGSINLDSGSIDTLPKDKIGTIIGDTAYYEFLSMETMGNMLSKFYQQWDHDKFSSLLKKFELKQSQKIESLSKGMKLKFMLACALSHHAELLLLDEPTSGIDPISRLEIMDILQDVISDGQRSILFSTHVTTDLDKVGDYITILNKGKLLTSTTKDQLLEHNKIVKASTDVIARLQHDGHVSHVMNHQFHSSAISHHPKSMDGFFMDDIVIENSTIENILLHLVKGA